MEPDGGDDGAGEAEPAAAFAALSDPLRVDILRALSAHHREHGGATPVGFADLRRRVGVRDSGRFRYHLNELRDRFVEKADGGYRLTHAGEQVVGAILAGTYTDDVSLGPAEIDGVCPDCGEAAVATCEGGVCRVGCANDHRLFQWSVPPNATRQATLSEVVDLAELLARQAIECSLAGVCPTCYDPVTPTLTPRGADEQPRFDADCPSCGGRVVGPGGFCLLVDSRVAAFYRRHGRPIDERHLWELGFVTDGAACRVVEEKPLCAEFVVTLDDETLVVTLDGRGRVVGVDGPDTLSPER